MKVVAPKQGEWNIYREDLRSQPECRFVEPEEFLRLLTSMRRLIRADVPRAAVRGLLDPLTGTRFVTEEEKLFA